MLPPRGPGRPIPGKPLGPVAPISPGSPKQSDHYQYIKDKH